MFEINEIGKKAAKGGIFLFFGIFLSTTILTIYSILIARLLGPDNYGLYTIIMIIPNFFIIFGDLGISPSLTRYISKYNKEGKKNELLEIMLNGILLKIIITFLLMIIIIIFSNSLGILILNRSNIKYLIKLTSLYLLGLTMMNTLNSIFLGLDKTKNNGLLTNIQAILRTIISPILIILGFGVAGVLYGIGFGFIFAAIIGMLFIMKYYYDNKSDEYNIKILNKSQIKEILFYGIPIYFSTIIQNAEVQSRNLFMTYNTTNADIGNYATAINFSVFINVLTYSITSVIFPAFSKLNINEEKQTIENILKLSVKYATLLVIPTAIMLVVVSKNIIYILYGHNYIKASFFLSIYLISYLSIGFGNNIIQPLLNSQGDTKMTLSIYVINLLVSICISYFLVPKYKILGILIAIICSQIISTFFGLIILYKKYKITISYVSTFKIILLSILTGLVIKTIVNFSPFINIYLEMVVISVFYFIIFFLVAPIVGIIKTYDLNNIELITKDIPVINVGMTYLINIEKKLIDKKNKYFAP